LTLKRIHIYTKMSSTKYINGQIFYYYLKSKKGCKSLSDDYTVSSLQDKIVICYEIEPQKRLYTVFDNYIQFNKFRIKYEHKYFHEVIHDFYQKPRFDVEMSIGENKQFPHNIKDVIENLIECIVIVLEEASVEISFERDLLLYESNGSNKKSIHIVINNWAHDDSVQAKGFYDRVTKIMNKEYVPYIDNAVYSKLQNFRTLGSKKHETTRVKRFMKEFEYKDKIYTHEYEMDIIHNRQEKLFQLGESLITNTGNCIVLPDFSDLERDEDGGYIKHMNMSIELDSDKINKAYRFLVQYVRNTTSSGVIPFRIHEVIGSLILLHREHKSYCRVCKRSHEEENAYMYICGGGESVYFNCRRNKESVHLGDLLEVSVVLPVQIEEGAYDKQKKAIEESQKISLEDDKTRSKRKKRSIDLNEPLTFDIKLVDEIKLYQ